jgi:hypothetical protein
MSDTWPEEADFAGFFLIFTPILRLFYAGIDTRKVANILIGFTFCTSPGSLIFLPPSRVAGWDLEARQNNPNPRSCKMSKRKKNQNTGIPEAAIKADFQASAEAPAQAGTDFHTALADAIAIRDAAPAPAQASAPLKEEKEKEAPKPPNRIEKEGPDFRLIVAGEKRGVYAFYASAAAAFENEVGRRPVVGEWPNGETKNGSPPAVINESRIKAAENGPGFDVFLDGKFAGWNLDLAGAEALLARVKAREAEKLAAKAAAPPVPAPAPTEVPAEAGNSPKPAKKGPGGRKKTTEAPAPSAGEAPSLEEAGKALAEHCAKTVQVAGVEAEVERIGQACQTLKCLPAPADPSRIGDFRRHIKAAIASYAEDVDGRRDAMAFILAEAADDLLRAEAERRGLLKPTATATRGNGTHRSHPGPSEEHRELTKKAWVIARRLAAEKGGKPQDHMKQAWAELVRD